MRLYRRLIPKIAKDILRGLMANKAIDLVDGKRDEAELDIAGSVVGYLNALDAITEEAKETLERANMGIEHLHRVKMKMADQKGLVWGSAALPLVVKRIIEGLYDSAAIEEIYFDDNELTEQITPTVAKYIGVDEDLDREIRSRLKNLREGTPEWEIEYNGLIESMRAQYGRA